MKYDFTNQKFDRLLVLRFIPGTKEQPGVWLCLCECGEEKAVKSNHLITGKVKSCGCLLALNSSTRPLETGINQFIRYNLKNGKKYPVELSREEIKDLIFGDCFYCGAQPSQVMNIGNNISGRKMAFLYNGIDRVDNTKGYSLNNCVTSCRYCNAGKNTLSPKEYIEWLENLITRFPL